MNFIHEDFLLNSKSASRLYHEFAAPEPILDFHCHLSPKDIAENRQFKNLFEIWLEGDHYKWRAMRTNGVPERFCTGDAEPFEKFQAWAATVPHTLRNPLYHWTHLELKRYFNLSVLLDETTAPRVWKQTNEQLVGEQLTTHGILKKFNVDTLCTTDDPVDDLRWHRAIAQSDLNTTVLPAFRPDKVLKIAAPESWNRWIDQLAAAANCEIQNFQDLTETLLSRIEFFHNHGCRLSDHGLDYCPANFSSQETASSIFDSARRGHFVTRDQQEAFATSMMLFLGKAYAKKGWAMQLHLGALRNANTRLNQQIGPDAGFDSIGDSPQAARLASFLDRLDQEAALPKTIVYNLNPADNYVFATMIGNFQDGTIPGKVQLGSGWWFLDQREAMEWQMNALSNTGLLSRFVGMVTDSRSFMSYPRHEYFRRTLCNLLGADIERGEIPGDDALIGPMIRNICFHNAKQYLALGHSSDRNPGL